MKRIILCLLVVLFGCNKPSLIPAWKIKLDGCEVMWCKKNNLYYHNHKNELVCIDLQSGNEKWKHSVYTLNAFPEDEVGMYFLYQKFVGGADIRF